MSSHKGKHAGRVCVCVCVCVCVWQVMLMASSQEAVIQELLFRETRSTWTD